MKTHHLPYLALAALLHVILVQAEVVTDGSGSEELLTSSVEVGPKEAETGGVKSSAESNSTRTKRQAMLAVHFNGVGGGNWGTGWGGSGWGTGEWTDYGDQGGGQWGNIDSGLWPGSWGNQYGWGQDSWGGGGWPAGNSYNPGGVQIDNWNQGSWAGPSYGNDAGPWGGSWGGAWPHPVPIGGGGSSSKGKNSCYYPPWNCSCWHRSKSSACKKWCKKCERRAWY